MKRLLLIWLAAAVYCTTNAQVTSLSENFDSSCGSATGFPRDWTVYNPTAGASDSLAWHCAPFEGEDNTGAIRCSGEYGGAYHSDTSLLLTPILDLSGYTGDSIFLHFDSKTVFISGERIGVVIFPDTSGYSATDSLQTLTPIISSGDSSGWVTHQVDLAPYKGTSFYIGFLYTSTNTYGTAWYIDNVNTTPLSLGVTNVADQKIPLTIVGSSTSSEIKITYNVQTSGAYAVALFDMMGRQVYKKNTYSPTGNNSYTLSGLNLLPGMYFIKIGNGASYGVAKTVVQ